MPERSQGVSGQIQAALPEGVRFFELQERLALSRSYVETILGRRRPFQFDRNSLGRRLGKDPLEIDLDVARRGGMKQLLRDSRHDYCRVRALSVIGGSPRKSERVSQLGAAPLNS